MASKPPMIDSGFAHTFKYFRPQSVYRTNGTTFNYSLNSFVTLLFNHVSAHTGRASCLLTINRCIMCFRYCIFGPRCQPAAGRGERYVCTLCSGPAQFQSLFSFRVLQGLLSKLIRRNAPPLLN